MIRHLVHLRFRSDIDEATKLGLYDRLAALSSRVDGLLGLQHRRNVAIEEPLVRGFMDMFWIDFRDLAARDMYIADEVHQQIGADIVACLEGGADGVFVCDVEL